MWYDEFLEVEIYLIKHYWGCFLPVSLFQLFLTVINYLPSTLNLSTSILHQPSTVRPRISIINLKFITLPSHLALIKTNYFKFLLQITNFINDIMISYFYEYSNLT